MIVMNKEYTYDIDKYTIGVDENGEDGIGMTVAKIENGEIIFLGNCYGENARCLDLLIKENQQLKKQLHDASIQIQELIERDIWCPSNCDKLKELRKQYCERTDCSGRIGNSKKVEELQQENEKLKKELKDEEQWRIKIASENDQNVKECLSLIKKKKKYESQRKQFIKYLEDEINKIEPKGTSINYNCEYDSEDDYIIAMEEQSKLITLKRILSAYKEIIGVPDERSM